MSSSKHLEVDETEIAQLEKEFFKFRPDGSKYGPEEICLPASYAAVKQTIDEFEIRDSDVFVAGYPKSGTTWMEELVWLVANNCDYQGAKTDIYQRYVTLEAEGLLNPQLKIDNIIVPLITKLSSISKMVGPRFIKTHLPWSLLPEQVQNGLKKPKIIVMARNPKDVCASYHHHLSFEDYQGDLENFSKLFLAGRSNWGPYWKNVLGYWERRHEPNVLFVKYGDMKEDLSSVIKNVGNLFGKTFDDRTMKRLKEHLSFESMKNNPAVNHDNYVNLLSANGLPKTGESFWMNGKIGSYKECMSPKLVDAFNKWTEANTAGTGLML